MGQRFIITESERNDIKKQYNLVKEGEGFFGNFGRYFGKPSAVDASKDALRSQGYSQMGRDDSSGNEDSYYTIFKGQKFYPDQIEYADEQDMGKIPRIEGDKLIIANPMWRE